MNPTNDRWLRKWLRGKPHQIIGADPAAPYLLRWYVIPRNPWMNVYIHKFLRSDDDRALHDHPWWFVSIMLRGKYDEITEDEPVTVKTDTYNWSGNKTVTHRRRAGSIAYRPALWRHRVRLLPDYQMPSGHVQWVPGIHLPEIPCWTLIITGRRTRNWGFWCPDKPWKIYTKPYNFFENEYHEIPVTTKHFVPWEEFTGNNGCGEP